MKYDATQEYVDRLLDATHQPINYLTIQLPLPTNPMNSISSMNPMDKRCSTRQMLHGNIHRRSTGGILVRSFVVGLTGLNKNILGDMECNRVSWSPDALNPQSDPTSLVPGGYQQIAKQRRVGSVGAIGN